MVDNPFIHADVLKNNRSSSHNEKMEEQTKAVQEALVQMQKTNAELRYTLDFILDPELVEYLQAADYSVTFAAERHPGGKQTTLIEVIW